MTATAPPDETIDAGTCPGCGVSLQPFQEYCLECGRRVDVDDRATGTVGAWIADARSRGWAFPVLVAVVVAAAATAAALAASGTGDADDGELIVATAPIPESVPVTPTVGLTAPEPATTTEEAETPPPARRQPPPSGPIAWPERRNGYTVVLASIRTAQGRRAAVERANEALAAGLDNVGILRSDEYASLADGFFVVFAGVHASLPAAERATGAARRAGYEDAYAAPVTR